MKRLLVVICLLSAFAQISIADMHFDIEDGFAISFADTWERITNHEYASVIFTSPFEDENDIFNENINVIAEYLPHASVERYLADTKAAIGAVGGKILSSGDVFIYGKQSKWIIYELSIGFFDLKYKAFFLVEDSTGFAITCTSEQKTFDKYVNLFDLIAKSFNVVDLAYILDDVEDYHNDEYGFSMKLPISWKENQSFMPFSLKELNSKEGTLITISAYDQYSTMSDDIKKKVPNRKQFDYTKYSLASLEAAFEGYQESFLAGVRNLPNFRLLCSGFTLIEDVIFIYFRYETTKLNKRVLVTSYHTLREGYVYKITGYISDRFSDYDKAILDYCMHSIRFRPE